MKNKIYIIIIFILINIITTKKSNADGWTHEKGKGLMMISAFLGSQNEYNIYTGAISDNKVNSTQAQIYGEYGLTDWLTIGSKSQIFSNFKTIHEDNFIDDVQYSSTGVNNSEIFFRNRIFYTDNFISSIYTVFKAPGIYDPNKRPNIVEPRTIDYGGGIELGYSWDPTNKYVHIYNAINHFISMNYHYRHKDNYYLDETRLEITGGIALNPFLMIILQFQKISIFEQNNQNALQNAFNPFALEGFTKGIVSLAVKPYSHFIIEVGYFMTYQDKLFKSNRTDIDYTGIMLNLWFYF